MPPPRRRTLLIFSQTFVPDPASVGQHMADVAVEMARRGHRVLVYAANRSYEDASVRYAPRENYHGVAIRRLALSSFGKRSIFTRVLGTASFLAQCLWLALFTPNVDGIFFSTSPPLIGVAAAFARILRGVPIAYWAMDLNPDQLIAMKKVKPGAPVTRLLEAVNRFILRNCALIVALDRFMADRIRRRGPYDRRMIVMPPWPHEQHVETVDHATNPFRAEHGLAGKFVVMYSGNHSPANPLRTLLDAAVRLKDDDRFRFLFVGGGIGKREVEQTLRDHGLKNAISLPYQPIENLRYSLSAADVHVVALGDGMVGIIHPCKVYGAMAVGRPVLFFGPKPSHISDLLEEAGFGLHVSHGDVDGAVAALQKFRDTDPSELARMGTLARETLEGRLSKSVLEQRFCDALEHSLGFDAAPAAQASPPSYVARASCP